MNIITKLIMTWIWSGQSEHEVNGDWFKEMDERKKTQKRS